MRHAKSPIEDFLENQGVEVEQLAPRASEEVEKRWLQVYARNVKKATGSWIHKGFKWHGFSCDYEAAIEGAGALREYQSQWAAPYVVFDEDGTFFCKCSSETYPDFSVLGADIYVAHHNMKWTMVFTHEQPHDGPYFATQKSASKD